jgi:hypothetical protein
MKWNYQDKELAMGHFEMGKGKKLKKKKENMGEEVKG